MSIKAAKCFALERDEGNSWRHNTIEGELQFVDLPGKWRNKGEHLTLAAQIIGASPALRKHAWVMSEPTDGTYVFTVADVTFTV